jgi:hypothetical protein
MIDIFDQLSGQTSIALYKNYIKFFYYIEFYTNNEENILEVICEERNGDKSTFSKHLHASIRINELLQNCASPTSYTEFSSIPISYFRKIDFENWNKVREAIGLKKHESKDWIKWIEN